MIEEWQSTKSPIHDYFFLVEQKRNEFDFE